MEDRDERRRCIIVGDYLLKVNIKVLSFSLFEKIPHHSTITLYHLKNIVQTIKFQVIELYNYFALPLQLLSNRYLLSNLFHIPSLSIFFSREAFLHMFRFEKKIIFILISRTRINTFQSINIADSCVIHRALI